MSYDFKKKIIFKNSNYFFMKKKLLLNILTGYER